MFNVVTCGFSAAPMESLPSHRLAVTLPHPAADDFLDRALDLLLSDGWDGATVLLLHDGRPGTEHAVRVLRSLLGRHGVLPLGVRLPLTGLAGVATVLTSLAAARLTAGAVVSSLPWILESITTRAVTRSVARLDYPGIGVSHQLATLLPGSTLSLRFGQRLLTGAAATAPLGVVGADGRVQPVGLLEAGERRLADRAGAPPAALVEAVEVTGTAQLADGWWGTPHYFEQTAVPVDLTPVGSRIASFPWRRCRECADAMYQLCQFCSAQEAFA